MADNREPSSSPEPDNIRPDNDFHLTDSTYICLECGSEDYLEYTTIEDDACCKFCRALKGDNWPVGKTATHRPQVSRAEEDIVSGPDSGRDGRIASSAMQGGIEETAIIDSSNNDGVPTDSVPQLSGSDDESAVEVDEGHLIFTGEINYVSGTENVFDDTFGFEIQLFCLLSRERKKRTKTESLPSLEQIVSELIYSKPNTIEMTTHDDENWSSVLKDRIGRIFVNAAEWPSWGPEQRLLPGNAWLKWRCICGDVRFLQVAKPLAEQIVEIRRRIQSVASSHSGEQQPGQPTNSQAAPRNMRTSSSGPINPRHPANESNDIALSNLNILNPNPAIILMVQDPEENRYVHFMVNTGIVKPNRLHRRDLKPDSICNDVFFHQLRRSYCEKRDWFSMWFGLKSFSHCEFYKFETYSPGRFTECESGIPTTEDPTYFYKPKPMTTQPPISAHEFYDRFHRQVVTCGARADCSCGAQDAVDRIPQRRFPLHQAGQLREQFWGIVAREKQSRLRWLAYILVSSAPGLIFFFLWVFAWDHDSLQDASVLLMISFTLLGILYASQLF
ncbi:hypothetical protein HD806DRAFT_473476 [Xylariaceae sp. AK1471]|nr:hypothetical protein HD806DRAFT_473476 [Xylariaceae sp. AK1471]